MAKVGELAIEIVINGKKAVAEIKNFGEIVEQTTREANQNVEQLRTRFQSIAKTGERLFFAFHGFKVLAAPISNLISLANLQEKAEKKVEQAVRSTGMAAGFTAEQLKQMASELQSATTFGDEEILNNVTAQLLTFTNITGENFKKTQEAALNLATVLDGDLQSAAIMLGKALNDPVSNLGALSRAGIQFSEDQEKLIKSLWETGRAAEAQKIILQELERQYGGQARAMAQTAAGQMRQFSNLLGDFKEKLGGLLKNVLLPLLQSGTRLLAWLNRLSPSVIQVGGALSGLLAITLKLSPAFRAWILNLRILGVTMQTAMGWIGILITAATLLYTAWNSNLFGIRDKLTVFWEYVKTVFQSIWYLVKDVGSRLLAYFENVFGFWKNLLKGNFDEAMNAAKNAKEAIVGNWDETLNGIQQLWEQNKQRIQQMRTEEEKAEEVHQGTITTTQQNALEKRLQQQQQHQEALKRLRELRIANIQNEFQRRLATVELNLEQEKAKWAGHADIITELERNAFNKISEINTAFVDQQIQTFTALKTKNIQLLEEELKERKAKIAAYFDALIAKYQGNDEAVKALKQQKNDALAALDNALAQRQKEISDEVKQYKIQNIQDEFERRRAEVEAWYQKEVEKAQGNAELLAEIERQKQEKLNEIANQEAEARYEHQWGLHQSMLEGLKAGYDQFFSTLLDAEMSAKTRREQIWNAMRGAFIRNLQAMLNKYVLIKAKEKIIHIVTEKIKTQETKTQTAARSSISIGALIKEGWQVLKNIGTYIGQIAVKLFSWFASKGPIGIALGLAMVPALVLGIRSAIRGLMKFQKGGIAKKEVLALIGEAGDSEAVIPLNQQGANFMAKLIPKIVVPQPQVTAAVQMSRLENEMSAIRKAIRELKLTANIDSTELAIVVENGQAQIGNFDF